MRKTTLCYIEHNNQYLMLHRIKKEHDPNQGKWIGVGGKLKKNETREQCLLREVKEETGLLLKKYQYRAIINFHSDLFEDEIMYLYTATDFCGDLTECNEGVLAWVYKDKVMELNLWEGDRIFLKKLLEDEEQFFELSVFYEGERLIKVTGGSIC